MRTVYLLTLLFSAGLSYGQVKTPEATVHIFRTGSHGNPIQIQVDGQDAFKLGYRESTTFKVVPGSYTIAACYGKQQSVVTLELRSGDVRFLHLAMDASRGARMGLTSSADAISLALTQENGISAPDVRETPLSADRISFIFYASFLHHAPTSLASGSPAQPPLPPCW